VLGNIHDTMKTSCALVIATLLLGASIETPKLVEKRRTKQCPIGKKKSYSPTKM